MNKRTFKKHRNMSYFIDAASKIIDEEGIKSVTIRKVADLAGYNSATLYNYFKNLDELIFYSSVRHLKNYTLNLTKYTRDSKGSIEKYYRVWECFCKYSFSNPQIYNIIFFSKYSASINNVLEEYYSIFPEELGEQPQDLKSMLLKSNLYERNLELLLKIESDGYLNKEDLNDINEMTLILYQGMLTKILSSEECPNVENTTKKMLKYIKQITTSFMK